MLDYPGWGLGIDRLQRLRYIGSFADLTRYDGNLGWFAPNLSMAANEAVYYNFEALREDQLDAEIAPGDVRRMIRGGEGERLLTDAEPTALADDGPLRRRLNAGVYLAQAVSLSTCLRWRSTRQARPWSSGRGATGSALRSASSLTASTRTVTRWVICLPVYCTLVFVMIILI